MPRPTHQQTLTAHINALEPHMAQPGDPLKSRWDLAQDSGLPFDAITPTVAEMRERVPHHSLVSFTEGIGYTNDDDLRRRHRRREFRTCVTKLRRVMRGVLAPEAAQRAASGLPADQQQQWLATQMQRMIDDLTAIMP